MVREKGWPVWLRVVAFLFVATLLYLVASVLTEAIDVRKISSVEGLHYVLPKGCLKEADCQSEVRRYLIVSGNRKFLLPDSIKDDDFIAGQFISWRKICPLWQNDCDNIAIWEVPAPELPDWAKFNPTPEPEDIFGG